MEENKTHVGVTPTKWEWYFQPQSLDAEYTKCLENMREGFTELSKLLQLALPDGRYKSIVLTKLEETAMFATKSLSHRVF